MGDWSRLNIRMPADLHRALAERARQLGITKSELHRQALVAHLAWLQALDLVDDGHTTEDLRDPAVVARLLGRSE